MTARQLQMQLQLPDFTQYLQELLARHAEAVAEHPTLEMLESAAFADIAATHALIQRCRAFGACVWYQFCVGRLRHRLFHLTYLKWSPVDTLKIDRSFVQPVLTDAQDSALVEGVWPYAHV